MRKGVRVSIFPAVAAVAALFIVLPQRGGDATVEMTGARGQWRYSPREAVRVEPGDRIAFTNESRVTHTATCVSSGEGPEDDCSWDSGDVQPGQTIFVTMPDEASMYTFACRYHGRALQMVGSISTAAGSEPVPQATPSPTQT